LPLNSRLQSTIENQRQNIEAEWGWQSLGHRSSFRYRVISNARFSSSDTPLKDKILINDELTHRADGSFKAGSDPLGNAFYDGADKISGMLVA
jgi:hypothetical protein